MTSGRMINFMSVAKTMTTGRIIYSGIIVSSKTMTTGRIIYFMSVPKL